MDVPSVWEPSLQSPDGILQIVATSAFMTTPGGDRTLPRGDYRAPSDSEATVWLEEINQVPDHDP
jgi:hypothetical protein